MRQTNLGYEPETQTQIDEAKPSTRPATCSLDCYEIERGVWIHRPWAGCTTVKPETPPQREVAVTCWHCGGAKRCDCIACWEEGVCVTCKGTGSLKRSVAVKQETEVGKLTPEQAACQKILAKIDPEKLAKVTPESIAKAARRDFRGEKEQKNANV